MALAAEYMEYYVLEVRDINNHNTRFGGWIYQNCIMKEGRGNLNMTVSNHGINDMHSSSINARSEFLCDITYMLLK